MYLYSFKSLEKNINILKKRFSLVGIKAEFEAEGSDVFDIARLRIITKSNNTKLHVKIGGVEAKNDIYQCISLGVDGIISPMVETEFGLVKFLETIDGLKLKKKPVLTINIETRTGFENIEKILNRAKGKIDNITTGRPDFSSSYLNQKINQNSNIINNAIINISKKIKKTNLKLTVGGGIDKKSIDNFKKMKIWKYVDKLETRKVILPTKQMLKNSALESCINFETDYIINKKEDADFKIQAEVNRLSNLKTRK